jgi:hypothetical protein
MTCCSHCEDAESLFSQRAARRDLRRYRKRGPHATTRHLLRMLEREDLRGRELLDIGGGIGALQHSLIQGGLSHAVQVDASTAYLQASQAEAARQGHRERVEYHHGDFVELSDELAEADVVTLDRVVCCYPDMPRLVGASAAKARLLYALSYPRDHGITRTGKAFGNVVFRLQGSSFRSYIHPPAAISAAIRQQGFELVSQARTLLWHVALYARIAPALRA